MSLASKPYYWFECDWPDCTAKSTGGLGRQGGGAADQAADSDWLILNFWQYQRGQTPPEETILAYCDQHTHWDEEKDERVPGPPA